MARLRTARQLADRGYRFPFQVWWHPLWFGDLGFGQGVAAYSAVPVLLSFTPLLYV
jgi:hypothetical protein